MNPNPGYANDGSLPTNGNSKRRWNDGMALEEARESSNRDNENSNHTTGSQSPWQAFKRLRVTHEDEDGDLFMNSPARLFPQGLHQQQQQQTPQHEHDSCAHQTAGQETRSEDATTTPVARNPIQEAPDTDYKQVNHVLGNLHQQRLEREQRQSQAAMQNQDYGAHHPINTRSPAVTRARSPRDGGSQSFHTPPSRRRPKVVHLHTDSKLR
jgi:hypothetical protein